GNILDQGLVFLVEAQEVSMLPLKEEEKSFLRENLFEKEKYFLLWSNNSTQCLFIRQKQHKVVEYQRENARKSGAKAWETINDWESAKIYHFGNPDPFLYAFIEGLMLASYRFDKYKSKKKDARQT